MVSIQRNAVIATLGLYGDEEIIQWARQKFKEFLQNNSALAVDQREPVFRILVKHGGQDEYKTVKKIFVEHDVQEVKLLALMSLGYINNTNLLIETLEFGLSGEVRDQDIMYAFGTVSSNPAGRHLTWNFLKNNWERIYKRFGDGAFLLVRFIEHLARIIDENVAKDIETFFSTHPAPSAQRTIKQCLESIRTNVRWLERDRKQVAEYLNATFP